MEEVRTALKRPLPREHPVKTDPGNQQAKWGLRPLTWNGSKGLVRNLLREESGTSAVEYGLLLAFIALGIIGAVTIFGNAVLTHLFELAASSFPH